MRRRSVALDCDGVILDSNEMKCAAFRQSLAAYPQEAVEPFLAFQRRAFGTSRYRLFDIFFADHLGRPPEPGERDGLISDFAAICRMEYPRQPFTPGAAETLAALNRSGVELWVVSGSDESELRDALSKIGVAGLFAGIYGSPGAKADNLAKAKREAAAGMIFVGDAEADFRASLACGVPFVAMPTFSAAPDVLMILQKRHGFPTIASLTELPTVLDAVTA